ncbi:MAG: stage V sporulation protein SpoVM [Oscillospiraceae bacterium]|nr:stage V sporulation protein SpoVM [Oscillospiraceae bacterium]
MQAESVNVFPINGGVCMKIVVMNSPKFLAPFLRMIFKIGRSD